MLKMKRDINQQDFKIVDLLRKGNSSNCSPEVAFSPLCSSVLLATAMHA